MQLFSVSSKKTKTVISLSIFQSRKHLHNVGVDKRRGEEKGTEIWSVKNLKSFYVDES